MSDKGELSWAYDPAKDSIVFKGHITSAGWENSAEAKVLLRMLRERLPKNDAATFLYYMSVIFRVAETPLEKEG
jgi:hypothetical protein